MMDEIRFLQNHLPSLAVGEYEIIVEQDVKRQGVALDKFTSVRTFSVRGDRLTLKPADVSAVFPPAGSQGDHANVLPHILLNRSTLPWERLADPGSPNTPWLALLLFDEGETPARKTVRLKDLNNGGARFPTFSKEGGQKDDDQVTVIDVPRIALEGILPGKAATGMFDVSYAAAWELGRLLALQSKTFSISLYNWKRAHAQQLRQAEEQLLHASPLDAESEPEPIPLPQEIAGWFKRLSLLEGVPFNYLVPDELLLPLESIRFFQLDWLWIECLLDGAFSIGRVTALDHRRDGAHAKSPAANPHAKVSGLLMRSEVASGWPGLLVDGFDGEKKLKLLRMDRLSANVLICLFDDQATAVDFHLRPEMAHFELGQKEGNFYKELQDQNGDKSNKTIGPIQLRQTLQNSPQRVVDISRLASDFASAINGNSLPVTSEQFALQMIVTATRVRFSQSTQTEDAQAH